MTVRLSLAMIVRDEERLLGRLLTDAAKVCDELVVVDTGSSDGTKKVAEQHGAVVHDIAWRDDFATARNASFAWCNEDWILWLDVDDVLPPSTLGAIETLKLWLADHEDIDAVLAPYQYQFAEDGAPVIWESRERILRRSAGFKWEGKVGERIRLDGHQSVFVPEFIVEHRPNPATRSSQRDRNMGLLEREIEGGHPAPAILYGYANELYEQGRHEDARRAYRQYLDVDRNPGPNRYWAQVCLAALSRQFGDDATTRAVALEAIGEDPSRAEAYVVLGLHYYDHEQWSKAAPLFIAATTTKQPTMGITRNPDYQYKAWDYLSVCLDRLERRQEALDAARRALPNNPESERVRKNMHWFVDNL
jgi:glycosyltransferase involved in cell wall biosynthesis